MLFLKMSTFHQCLRQVVDPSLPLPIRHTALVFCLHKLALITFHSGDLAASRRAQRRQFNQRFGFDDPPSPQPEQLVAAVAFAQAEYNKLRHVQQVIYRRRVSQKMRGRRQTTRKDQQEWDALWDRAMKRYQENLERWEPEGQ